MEAKEQEAKLAEDTIRKYSDPSATPEEVERDVAETKASILGSKPVAKEEQPAADKPQEDTEPKSEDTPTEEPEPEPLEMEKALAALRRGRWTEKQIGRLSQADRLERGLELAKMQSEFDSLKRDHAELKSKATEKPATEAKTPATVAADTSKKVAELFGEEAAPALTELVQTLIAPLVERLETRDREDAKRTINAAREALRGQFPQVGEDETWNDVLDTARGLAATPKYKDSNENECLTAACRALGFDPKPSTDKAEKETEKRLNGTPKSAGRVTAPAGKTKEDLKYEAFLAWEEGDKQKQQRLLALARAED